MAMTGQQEPTPKDQEGFVFMLDLDEEELVLIRNLLCGQLRSADHLAARGIITPEEATKGQQAESILGRIDRYLEEA